MSSDTGFKGTYTALVTPFRDGYVDTDAFADLIKRQIEGGVDGVVPVGTTGEAPTLNHEEHLRVIELAVELSKEYSEGSNRKVKVLAGTGSNSTLEAIEYTQGAQKLGADGALMAAPYYNKPSQQGLFRHYTEVAASTELPIVLYSIPSRCGIEIGVDTAARLAEECSNIVAIKEAGGSVDRVSKLRQVLPDTFDILSGDDSQTVPFMSVGAVGVISVASNIIPGEVKQLVDLCAEGNFKEAEKIHRKLYPLFCDLFIEPNPVPAKAVMASRGWMTEEVRLPLCGLTDGSRSKLFATVDQVGVS